MDDLTSNAVSAYFDAISQLDADAWRVLFTEDCETRDPADSRPWQGIAGIEKFFARMTGMMESVSLTPEEIVVRGDGAAASWRGWARTKDGKEASYHGINFFETDGAGKIRRVTAFWHPEEMMRQLA